LVRGKLKFASNAAEAMILWRRIAGGIGVGQQQALWQEVQGRVRDLLEAGGRAKSTNQESAELLRLVGSLEQIAFRDKKWLGDLAIKAIRRSKLAGTQDSILWMIGRIGARSLVYAPLNDVVPTEIAEGWADQLCELTPSSLPHQLALMQLTRRTGDRYRDVSAGLRGRVLETLERWSAPESYRRLVREVADLDHGQDESIIGEALPLGIRIATR
jgi:hypothetical protein